MPDLPARWRAWVAAATQHRAPPDAMDAAGARVLAAYREPHRRYHDERHLAEVLAALDLLIEDVPPAVRGAAFLHDAVYDPAAPDNEARSADLAADLLPGLGVPAPVVGEVVRLVLLTRTHRPAPDDPDGALLCDADLAVLAAGPARYGEYAQAVREEYAHLPDEAFRAGRAAVLRDLLAHPRLFSTEAGRARWEAAARRSMSAELAVLTGPVGLSAAGGGEALPR